jgi:type VII secretion integral membrane protein EccD
MTTTAQTPELCRIVLVAPTGSVEMALPSTVALCDLLPALVHQASSPSAGAAGAAGADEWVLQRLGEEPLDEELTPTALGIRDGELLYLRPRPDRMPPVHFDDLIDGLATGVRDRADRWRGWMTRQLFLAVAAASLLLGFGLLRTAPPASAAVLGGACAGVLLAAGGICSRAFGDAASGLVFGCAAVPYAGYAGLLVPTLPAPASFAAPNVLCLAVAGGVAALFAMGLVGEVKPMFLALALGFGATAAGAALLSENGGPAAGGAAVAVILALLVGLLAPNLAFRLARLRLPMLPRGADDLAADIEPYRPDAVLTAAATADRYVSWLFGMVGAVSTVGLAVLVRAGGGAPLGLAGALSLVLLLRARALLSAWQRIAALLPAGVGIALLAWHFGATPGRTGAAALPGWVGGLLLLAGAAVLAAHKLPGRRLLPYWGRLADIAEYLAVIAVLPLTAAVFGLLGWARALAG